MISELNIGDSLIYLPNPKIKLRIVDKGMAIVMLEKHKIDILYNEDWFLEDVYVVRDNINEKLTLLGGLNRELYKLDVKDILRRKLADDK